MQMTNSTMGQKELPIGSWYEEELPREALGLGVEPRGW